jgi:hypothetical protein
MQFTRGADDVVDRVASAQARPDEHAPDVNVDRNIAPAHVVERDSKVAGQDFDRHGGLLLADAIKRFKPRLKGPSGRPVCPQAPYIAIEFLRNPTGGAHDPARPDRGIPVRHRPGAHGPEDTQLIAGHPHGIEVTKALMQGLGRLESAFCGDPLIKQDGEKQREWVSSEKSLGSLRRREPSNIECASKLEHRRDDVRLASKAMHRLERAF